MLRIFDIDLDEPSNKQVEKIRNSKCLKCGKDFRDSDLVTFTTTSKKKLLWWHTKINLPYISSDLQCVHKYYEETRKRLYPEEVEMQMSYR